MSKQPAIRFHVGEKLSAAKMNQLAAQAQSSQGRFFVEPEPRPQSGARLFQIQSVNDGPRNLTCVPYGMTADPNAALFTVQLPLIFSEGSRAGNAYSYTSLNARTVNGSVTEEITPNLIVGDEALCVWETRRATWRLIMEGRMWAELPP